MANDMDLKKGDVVVSKHGTFIAQQRLKFLAYSDLDNACFIGEDAVGDVRDDWSIADFEKEYFYD